ncbi:MAG TPA: ORF6N domain-containing protein [Verrucomicrobiae bacterium]
MKGKKNSPALEPVEPLIQMFRAERVILDSDLARIYGVETGALNRAVKRNSGKFPADFMFQLTAAEFKSLRCQIGILKPSRGKHRKFLPFVFTEHGAIMAANVLNSPQAVQMSVFVVRAFVKMRGSFSDSRELVKKLAALEKELKSRLDVHEVAIVEVLQRVMAILDPPPPPPEPPHREIGFHVKPDDAPKSKARAKK